MMNAKGLLMLFLKILYAKRTCRFTKYYSEMYINSAFKRKANCKNRINAPHVPVGFNRILCFEYVPSTIK